MMSLGLSLPLHAQVTPPSPAATEPPVLVEMRKKFEAAAGSETALLNDLYQRALSGVQANAAAEGDYEQALAAKRRREQLISQTNALREQSVTAPGTVLPLAEAKLAGGLTLSPDALALAPWRSELASAEWVLSRITPGRYEVELLYRWADAPGSDDEAVVPQWVLREVSTLPGAAANVLRFTLPKKASAPDRLKATGVLTISALPFTLRLTAAADYEGYDLALMGVRLLPPTAPAPAPLAITQAVDMKAELDQLMKTHAERLRAARDPVVADYMEMLAGLGERGAAGRKVVDAEVRRAKSLLEGSKDLLGGGSSASGKAGLTSLSDVSYVHDEANTATRFKVEHEGQSFWVRMLWVASPPADPKTEHSALRLARERFGLDELSAVALGQAAKEFTELYLTDKPLRLLARANPAADGSLQALVYVDPVGLFQNVLVDHGLAVVDAPGGTGKRAALEAGIVGSLLEREARAKAATPAEGGWAK